VQTPRESFLNLGNTIYCFADHVAVAAELVAGGARIMQFRNKYLSDNRFAAMAEEILNLTRQHGVLLIVNDRVDVALAIEADGVHIGQRDEDFRQVVQRVPEQMIVGISARTVESAKDAQIAGATYIGAGAVFSSPTKPNAPVIGVDGLRAIVDSVGIPVVAIGGIDRDNLLDVARTGARHYAIISHINRSNNIAGYLSQLIELLEGELYGNK
jgi:thiamine-phosphate pyrophosphorylase